MEDGEKIGGAVAGKCACFEELLERNLFEEGAVEARGGGEEGLGRGFYYQMAGFENGRLQTTARSVGVMQAAYEAALDYAARARSFIGASVHREELEALTYAVVDRAS